MQKQLDEEKEKNKKKEAIDPYYARNPRTNRHNKVPVENRERDLDVYYQLGNNNTSIRRNNLFRM